jgi:putative SOS response-associated peptidase YedK
MCGRFLIYATIDRLQRQFRFSQRPNLQPRYNVAPSQDIPMVRTAEGGGERELAFARWGLIPFWAKDAKFGFKCINARAESLATTPAFREAYRRRRCLIPADGFYEWRTITPSAPAQGDLLAPQPPRKASPARKQPVLIRRRSHEPFAFAGLWERWKGPEGEVVSATIITTQANRTLAPIHERMPVILPPEAYDRWLDTAAADADALLVPCADDLLELTDVSTRVNSVKDDDPDLIAPLAA